MSVFRFRSHDRYSEVFHPLDLGLGWYISIRVGTVYRVCVILVFEYLLFWFDL